MVAWAIPPKLLHANTTPVLNQARNIVLTAPLSSHTTVCANVIRYYLWQKFNTVDGLEHYTFCPIEDPFEVTKDLDDKRAHVSLNNGLGLTESLISMLF